ncbi:hypothetical protein EW146_g8345 [Bondarzewia mesenterica]|uniref:inositol-phosphate phosphatase n=1 Tax=Bondarzewia mesenterica TaxID=1095465 RepID=A0A4S4LF52_9AGAM|nr:hypothetical protein EW146_g8345 [Bondarzewia mesenterica]
MTTVTLPQARAIALTSFAINFGAQVYGMLSSPNMKEVADANHYAFSPNPWFIAGFFSMQTVLHVFWLKELWFMHDAHPDEVAVDAETRHATLTYVPVYALGNLCIAAWLFFWLHSQFIVSQVLVTINTFAQLFAVFSFPVLSAPFSVQSRPQVLLHLVAKTFAGIGVLDFLDNGGVAFGYTNPGVGMQVLVPVGFIILAMLSDPIFGACLVYDLVALAVGQRGGKWGAELGWYAGATGLFVAFKSLRFFHEMKQGQVKLAHGDQVADVLHPAHPTPLADEFKVLSYDIMPQSQPLDESQLREVLTFATDVAHSAGRLILEGSRAIQHASASDIAEKKNSVDLVTEYDVKVEELVKREIASRYPTFKLCVSFFYLSFGVFVQTPIGEETWSSGTRPTLTEEPTFCVDPIDGTTNFVHGFPFACISIGLIDQKRPVLGVIYNPFLDHLYTGIKGQGSFLSRNGSPQEQLPLAPARPLPSLSQALVAIEWGSDRKAPVINKKAESFLRLAGDPAGGVERGRMAHSLRSVGSAALNFALVAQGSLDLYWEIGCWYVRSGAGIVIAQEAGGFVTGGKDSLHDGDVTEAILTGRKYLVIRGIAGSAGETAIDAQKKIVKEFYDTVEDVDPE